MPIKNDHVLKNREVRLRRHSLGYLDIWSVASEFHSKIREFLDEHTIFPNEPIFPTEHTISFEKRGFFLVST